MTDRELLELAAKAAGIAIDACGCGSLSNPCDHWLLRLTPQRVWDPLRDDAQALRLAVKLGIGIEYCFADGFGETQAAQALQEIQFEDWKESDGFSATRRAIVRAAAELGRTMK